MLDTLSRIVKKLIVKHLDGETRPSTGHRIDTNPVELFPLLYRALKVFEERRSLNVEKPFALIATITRNYLRAD